MKIKKDTPPDRLKESVMQRMSDDGYAKELVSLPENTKKKTHIIPYLTTAAAIALVFCATLYVAMGADRKSDKGTNVDNEFSTGSTEADEESPLYDADGNKGSGTMIEGSVTNDNAFVPEAEDDCYKEDYGEDENRGENADKSQSAPVTVTLGDNTVTLSVYDSARVRTIVGYGEPIEYDCVGCSYRYTIQIDGENYLIHSECGNVECGHRILHSISIPTLDNIVKNYIDIE